MNDRILKLNMPFIVSKDNTARQIVYITWFFGMLIAGLSILLLIMNTNTQVPERWGFPGFQTIINIPSIILGGLIAKKHFRNPIGWLLLGSAVFGLITGFGEEFSRYVLLTNPGILPYGEIIAGLTHWLWIPSMGLIAIHVFLYFPDGKLVSPRWRFLAWAGFAWIVLGGVFIFLSPGPLDNLNFINNPFGVSIVGALIKGALPPSSIVLSISLPIMVSSVISLILRYIRSESVIQQKIKWIAFLAILVPITGVVGLIQGWVADILLFLFITSIPASIAIAILRHHLYDIDILINRTLVYASLTIIVASIYIFIVGIFGSLLTSIDNSWISFFSTGVVAVIFQPLRDRLQKWVNSLMYGERDDPVSVLTKLGQEIERTVSPQDALESIVKTVADTLRIPYVVIELGNERYLVDSNAVKPIEKTRFPMHYQSTTIGHLVVAPRSPGENFTNAEKRLLQNIARQAGAAAHAAELSANLKNSHQRLVSTREEERRRIRRDLHDGLGPHLASQSLTLNAIEKQIERDPNAALRMIRDLKSQSQDAITYIRHLIYDLRPPTLDSLGLVEALRERFHRFQDSLSIQIISPQSLSSLPAAVEVAAFRICQEAIINTVRHADASDCSVSITLFKNDLFLEIRDNGRGIPPHAKSGVGLTSMRERAEELCGRLEIDSAAGKGTTIRAWLPYISEAL